ncbi:copper resistance CopC family protein [Ornithinimicrobium avium]|uniref:Copper resistance protein CopC n=1 Tax=Ornithinimicrobium avium TaxID=2283195 RepID=A0A345NMK3_9MICO|nr:copper resistance CopC family protein [Ornithinimicrobium avium]AXH96261.1 copper resistance protein CopC [Ornithinimicrobium avium]
MPRPSRLSPSASFPFSLALLLAALLAALLVVPAGSASAHDQLTGTEPTDGATVEQAPGQVVLTFSGEVADVGAQVLVAGPDGETVGEGDPQVSGSEVTQQLRSDLPAGAYEVTWRVTSQDGHPISGTFAFEATETSGATSEAGSSEAGASDAQTSAAASSSAAPTTTGAGAGDDAGITAAPDSSDGAGGLPVWAWVVVILAALGLLGLLARTWTRGRG